MVFAELAILNFLKLYFHNSKRKPLKPEDFRGFGAASQIRTGDLILTKDVKSKQYIECPWYLHEDITGFMFMLYNHIYIQEENHEESIHDQEPQT